MLVFLICIIIAGSIFLTYTFLKPYTRTTGQRKQFVKFSAFFIPLALLAYFVTNYAIGSSTPPSFKAVVDSLENNSLIKSKVGDYESFSYNDKDLPLESDNPATVKIELNGSSGSLYLTCNVIKNDRGKWQVVQVVEDSLVFKK